MEAWATRHVTVMSACNDRSSDLVCTEPVLPTLCHFTGLPQAITVGSGAHVQDRFINWTRCDIRKNETQRESTCVPRTWCASFRCDLACTSNRYLSSFFHTEEKEELAPNTGLSILVCTFNEPQKFFLTFRFGVPWAVRCTWTKWQWKLVHSPYQHPAASCLRKNTSPCTCHEFSTAVRWLSYVDISWLVGLQYGSRLTSLSSLSHSIDAGSGIEPLTSNVDDVGNVGVDKLDNEDIVDKPSTIIATCFTCDRRRKSACWRSSWQVFPHIFSKQFWWGYRWSLYRLCWCAMTSCFGRWWKPVWFSKKVFLNFSSNLDGKF